MGDAPEVQEKPDKLTRKLPEMYAELHAAKAFRGDSWRVHTDTLLVLGYDQLRILDYGCGPDGGIADGGAALEAAGIGAYRTFPNAIPYDPFVPQYAADPWVKDPQVFFSCDVFEHLREDEIDTLLRRIIKQTTLQYAYIVLSTRAATKTFSNGLNVHLTVKHPDWWLGMFETRFRGHFVCHTATYDMLRNECVFSFARKPCSSKSP